MTGFDMREQAAGNKEVVRKFMTAMPVRTANDESIVRSTMAEDGIWQFQLAGDYSADLMASAGDAVLPSRSMLLDSSDPSQKAKRWTREEMIKMHLGVDERMQRPYVITTLSLVAEDDKVVVEAVGDGVTRANGKPYRQRYCFHLTLKDGWIVEGRVYQDTLHQFDTWVWSLRR